MADSGYVRSYTRRNPKRRRRRSNNSGKFLLTVLCLLIAVLVLVLVIKHNSGDRPEPPETSVTSGQVTTEKTKKPDDESETQQGEEKTTGGEGETQGEVTTEPTTIAVTTTKPVTEPSGKVENGAIKIKVDDEKWMLTLVNKYYTVGKDYKPKNLVKLPGSDGASNGNNKLDSRAAVYFEQMFAQCEQDTGVILNTVSAYRTYDYQDGLFEAQVKREINRGMDEESARLKAATVVARPGTSDHNLGLGIDIGRITEDFETSKGYKWLSEHAQDYGFVLRYPKDKQNITHVIYEPWHWRYVGVEAAKEMKAKGICLEEYLGLVDPPAGLK